MMVYLKTSVTLQIYEASIVDCYTDAVIIPTTTAIEWDPGLARELAQKAGQSTVAAARRKAPLDIGEAVVTPGGGMLACFIIHVALPDTMGAQGMASVERQNLLETAVRNGLLRCTELAVPSVGLPNIGRSLGFSAMESAQLILAALFRNLPDGGIVDEIHLVLRDSAEVAAFAESAAGACA